MRCIDCGRRARRQCHPPASRASTSGQGAAQEARARDPAGPEATQASACPGKRPTGPQNGTPTPAAERLSAFTAYPPEGNRRRKGVPGAPGLPSNQPTAKQSGATADA